MTKPTDWRSIAALQERLFTDELGMLAFESRPWCGGLMGVTKAGLWCNASVAPFGMGEGTVTEDDLAELCAFFEPEGVEPRTAVTTYAPDETFKTLGGAGFRLAQFGTIFTALPDAVAPAPLPEGVTVEIVDPGDTPLIDETARAMHMGFAEGAEPNEDEMRLGRTPIENGRVITLVARVKGELVAAAGINIYEDLGYLAFATTLEPYRGRGIHAALIAERVKIAKDAGCTLLSVAGRPGGGTERNAARLGFTPAYTRLSFVKPGEGLVGNP